MRDLERRLLRLEQARGPAAPRVYVRDPLPGESREDELARVFGSAGPPAGQVVVTVVTEFADETGP